MSWRMDGKLLEQTGEQLILKQLTREQHGKEIVCEASNAVGAGKGSLSMNVTCKYKPTPNNPLADSNMSHSNIHPDKLTLVLMQMGHL